jgi:hypothetical protein
MSIINKSPEMEFRHLRKHTLANKGGSGMIQQMLHASPFSSGRPLE